MVTTTSQSSHKDEDITDQLDFGLMVNLGEGRAGQEHAKPKENHFGLMARTGNYESWNDNENLPTDYTKLTIDIPTDSEPDIELIQEQHTCGHAGQEHGTSQEQYTCGHACRSRA